MDENRCDPPERPLSALTQTAAQCARATSPHPSPFGATCDDRHPRMLDVRSFVFDDQRAGPRVLVSPSPQPSMCIIPDVGERR